MLIENPEALRLWLEDYLPPLCDADPEVLAKYCLALVRKDRKDEDLKSSMVEALDVFLKDNTNTFVDVFLSVLKSKSYLPKVVKQVSTTTSPVKPTVLPTDPVSPVHLVETKGTVFPLPVTNSMSQPSQPPLPLAPPPPPDNTNPHPPPDSPPPLSPLRKEEVTAVKPRKDMDRDERRRKRSNSRLRDRSRRSRSRGRSSRNKYDDRRRRSPHSKRYRRTRSRSRSSRRSRSPARRSRSRDRRSRSVKSSSPKRSNRHRSRSRSPFTKTTAKISPSKSPIKDNNEESNSKDELVDKDGQGFHRGSGKFRCRDYDEQGFCMRGDQCPFDHGSDPVVLEGASLEFPPPTITPTSSQSANSYTTPPTVLGQDISVRPLMPHPPPPRGAPLGEYTPTNPSIWSGDPIPNIPMFYGRGRGLPGSRYTGPHTVSSPDMGRELISVPVDSNSLPKTGARPPLQRLGQVHSNGSFHTQNAKYADNCTLELKKIPSGMNTIALLNQHFTKFGSITNIQVLHGGDPEAALVTFCNNSEASAAYRSTEAVLNNRFIKIFWHNPHKTDSCSLSQRNIHDRLGNRHPNKSLNNKAIDNKNEKVVLTKGGLMKTVYNSNALQPQSSEVSTVATPDSTPQLSILPSAEEIKKLEIETICKQQELLKAEIAAHNQKEKKKADAMKLKTEVEQRTRQLLDKQMAQVKVLVNKLDINKANMKPEEMKSLVGTIKSLQSAVDATKKRLLATPVAYVLTGSQTVKSKTQLDKEILDAELELYNVQSEGGNINYLKSRLQLLRVQVGHLKGKIHYSQFPIQRPILHPIRGRGIIRGFSHRSRGRGKGHIVNAVDRRTTTIHVSGFEKEDKTDVLCHFAALGSITNYTWDRYTPSISVQFVSRREAEKAMTEGANLKDRLLTLTWTHSNPQEEAIIPNEPIKVNFNMDDQITHSITTSTHDDTEEITEEIIEVVETVEGDDELLLYDDDDESEGRSWRR